MESAKVTTCRASFSKTSCAPSQPESVENQADPLRAEVEKHIGVSAGIKQLQAVEILYGAS
jgi:hypothetical protein